MSPDFLHFSEIIFGDSVALLLLFSIFRFCLNIVYTVTGPAN